METMDQQHYAVIKNFLTNVRGGKRIGTDAYFHFSYPGVIPFLESFPGVKLIPEANVVRFGARLGQPTLSFLHYKLFFEDAFPALVWSAHTILPECKTTRRHEGSNPAILHRKELLLADGHLGRAEYLNLTHQLISEKLLPAKTFVGRRDHWNRYLLEKGFHVLNGKLVALNSR